MSAVEQPLLSAAPNSAVAHNDVPGNGDAAIISHKTSLGAPFLGSTGVVLAAIVVLFSVFVRYPEHKASDAHVEQYYMWYLHVAIMIFVGFGFLMTFLRSYSYSAVGLNFMTSAFVILFAIFCLGAVQQEIWKGSRIIELDLPLLIDGNFCAGAAMISFGALLAKVSPTQLLWLLLLEVPLYTLNAWLAGRFGALDVGGSITIHAFGAYYGLAASLVLSKPGSGSGHGKNGAIVTSDMTAMIGTLFLWIFWPSFNGALASKPGILTSPDQFHCVLNTVLSLLGACCAAFGASAAAHGKLDMVHIQNATLAGGVAIGSAANLYLTPAGALAVGIFAGCFSTAGFAYLQPFLEARCGLQDTCGVHNLHGMPGVLGGLVAGLAALAKPNMPFLLHHSSGGAQLVHQVTAIAVSVGIAAVGGAVAALLVSLLKEERLAVDDMYDDEGELDETYLFPTQPLSCLSEGDDVKRH